MALLETRGDYQFADNVERLANGVDNFTKACLALVDENRELNARLNALSEVVAEQSQVMEKILRTCSEIPVTNNRPDAVLF